MHSVNGPMTVTIPSNADADIEANNVNGGISNDFGLSVRSHHFVGHDLRGTLGKGGVHFALENVNGSIAIRHANDGKPLSKATSTLDSDNEHDSRL